VRFVEPDMCIAQIPLSPSRHVTWRVESCSYHNNSPPPKWPILCRVGR